MVRLNITVPNLRVKLQKESKVRVFFTLSVGIAEISLRYLRANAAYAERESNLAGSSHTSLRWQLVFARNSAAARQTRGQ